MKSLTAIAAATIMAIAATPASAQQGNAGAVQTSYSPASLETVLSGYKAKFTRQADSKGNPLYRVTYANGASGTILLAVCNDAKDQCQGTLLSMVFTKPDKLSRSDLLNFVNTYNIEHRTAKTQLLEDNRVWLNAYLIADGGVTMANYADEIGLFINSTATLSQALYAEK